MGYDITREVYNTLWIDSLSTGFYLTTGQCHENEGCDEQGVWDGVEVHRTTRLVDDRKYTIEMVFVSDGMETGSSELTCERSQNE